MKKSELCDIILIVCTKYQKYSRLAEQKFYFHTSEFAFSLFSRADKKKCFPISDGYLLFLWQIKLRQKVNSMTTLVDQLEINKTEIKTYSHKRVVTTVVLILQSCA